MMARKRYETAFIPSTTGNQSNYPDIDSLLLSIDGIRIGNCEAERHRPTQKHDSTRHHRWRSKSTTTGSCQHPQMAPPTYPSSISPPPTPSSQLVSRQIRESNHQRPGSASTDSQVSLSDKESQGSPHYHSKIEKLLNKTESLNFPTSTISFSEPLRPKYFLTKSFVSLQSTNSSTYNSPLPRGGGSCVKASLTGQRSQPKRNTLTFLKVNSASSLDSIDSEQSVESKCLGSTKESPPKLLSPISDKSPIEPSLKIVNPKSMMGSDGLKVQVEGSLLKEAALMTTAAQLTNLPWEMPKLKRKLALLVDSGISLDTGSNSRETDFWSFGIGNKSWIRRGQAFQFTREPKTESIPVESVCQGHVISDSPPTTQVPPPPIGESQNLLLGHAFESKPDRCKMKLDFGEGSIRNLGQKDLISVSVNLEGQDWFHGAITRIEAEEILRMTKTGSFLVRNCESAVFNRYSLSVKSSRGFIHVRIESKFCTGKFCLGADAEEFDSIPSLVLHFMSHRLPIKGAEHVLLKYPVITNLL